MSISDEAVEAAAKYLGERFFWNGPLLPEVAREVLEAAAPHLMAAAWDEAMQDADDEGYLYAHQSDAMKARNPYRSAAVGE
jgi:hypothetical protein